jgi:hypothetical protein
VNHTHLFNQQICHCAFVSLIRLQLPLLQRLSSQHITHEALAIHNCY